MTDRPLRVLVLGDFRSFHLIRYADELTGQGCEVVTASLEEGAVVSHKLRRRGIVSMMNYSLSCFEIRRLIKAVRPDIISAHFASGYGFSAALAVNNETPPVVLHLWGSDILVVPKKSVFHRRKTAFALNSADLIIGDSRYLIEEAKKLAKMDNTHVIPWGIEEQFLSLHRADYCVDKPLRIIVPRPHESVYNNQFLLRALAGLVRDGSVRLTFPAFGSLYELFRAEAEQIVPLGIDFYEKLPRDEFLALMASHDCYLSASRSDSSPVSLIEAMALGLLPVAADIPGVREWLSPDNGWLFKPDNENDLQSIISAIASGNDSYRDIRTKNLERVKSEGLFEQNIADTIALMRIVVRECRMKQSAQA